MDPTSPLLLHEERLNAGEEWELPGPGWVFLWLLSGEGYLMRCSPTRIVSNGMLVIHAGGLALTLRASQLAPIRFRWFRLDPTALFGVFTFFERRRIDHPEQVDPPLPWVLDRDHPTALHFAGTSPNPEASCLGQRARLLELISAALSPPPFRSTTPVGSPRDAGDRLDELLSQLTDAELMTLPVEELARRCRCETKRLLLVFRERYGGSLPGQQREWLKVKACFLLSQPEADITSVAMACGYPGADAFRAWFRRQFGMAPTEWQRRREGKIAGQEPATVR